MRLRHAQSVAFALVFALAASGAAAQPRDPSLDWRTLETPHFTIHYHVPLGMLARRVAIVAERAHATLAEVMGYTGGRRTHVVLSDESDSANGSATALPFNTIRLFATAPSAMSPLSDYDDWLNMLVTHEHTHIVHLDQWSGVASFINLLLGKVYAPNHVQPRWLLEGVATWQETERTAGGRVRSSMFDMFLRMDALEERPFELDQMSNGADRWPHGNVFYLYGSHFIDYIARNYGREAIATISRAYGDSWLPWGINRVARRATGRSFVELYDDFLRERRAHYRAQRDSVIAAGRVEGERLTFHGEIARLPRFTRDGRVMYWRADGRSRTRVMRFALDAPNNQETLARVAGDPGYALHPSQRAIFFTRTDNYRDIYFFHDIFRRDLDGGNAERLTTGLRAREPDVSPDGRRIVFTVNDSGTTHLMIAELRDIEATARPLLRNERFEQVFNPRFSPDGRLIAVSRWQRGGYRDIALIDAETGAVSAVTHDRAEDCGPAWSPDGETLYFHSDRSGIANIYAFDLTSGRLRQITNVVSGAYQPAISPDGRHLVYVGYTSFGFDLFHLDLTAAPERDAAPYVDTRPPPVVDDDIWQGLSRDYQPLETLWPRAYMIDLANDGFGEAIGITVTGEDLAGWHRWRVRATTGFVGGNINVDASYEYRRGPVSLSLGAYRRVVPRTGFVAAGEDRQWQEHALGVGVGMSYALPESFSGQSLSLGWRGSHSDNWQPFRAPIDPNDRPPTFPQLGFNSSVRLGWAYSDQERYQYDISTSAGRAIGFNIAASHPAIGSAFSSMELTWYARQFLLMPWLEHHVLALQYTGGFGGGDVGRRPIFSVGGWSDGNPLDALINGSVLGGNALRGYPAFGRSGTQFHLVQVEYRFPIWRLNRGPWTLPVFLDRIYAAVYCDVGDAFTGRLDLETFRVGVGGHVLIDFTIGYLLPFTLRVGYARGLMEGGIDQFYGHLGVPF